jgi:hypothetical protein
LPAGDYRIATNEELIQELSFPVYRRAAMIFVPAESRHTTSVEMVNIDPRDLQEAQDRDAEVPANAGCERLFDVHPARFIFEGQRKADVVNS